LRSYDLNSKQVKEFLRFNATRHDEAPPSHVGDWAGAWWKLTASDFALCVRKRIHWNLEFIFVRN
jgi:phage terminase small subunit